MSEVAWCPWSPLCMNKDKRSLPLDGELLLGVGLLLWRHGEDLCDFFLFHVVF